MSVRALETVTRVAPLGIRFLDELTGVPVSDGLTVLCDGRRAMPNRSHVFVARGLPGLGEVERGRGDGAFGASPPGGRTYRVEVTDAHGRFHSVWFDAQAPTRGLFTVVCGSPPSPPRGSIGIPLLSAPARIPPAGLAVLRAELRDATTGGPAAYARLAVEGGRGSGVADDRGEVMVAFPYPRLGPVASSPPSPPAAVRRPLLEESWTVRLDAFYAPAPEAARASLCRVLTQPYAQILRSRSPAVPLTAAPEPLRFGRELVVREPLYLNPPA